MPSKFIWVIALMLGLSAIVLSAGTKTPATLMAASGVVSLFMAILAIRQDRSLRAAGASQHAIYSSTARFMGLVWTWGALGLLIVYKFILVEWKEWWHFFLLFAAIAVLCLFFAATMDRDAKAGRDDDTMLKLGRALTWGQLVGMLLTMAGLLIDPNKSFLTNNSPDWAGNIIFFAGAFALAAISANALLADRKPPSTGA